jgi:hypothetical protein
MTNVIRQPCEGAFFAGYRLLMLGAVALASAISAAPLLDGKKPEQSG